MLELLLKLASNPAMLGLAYWVLGLLAMCLISRAGRRGLLAVALLVLSCQAAATAGSPDPPANVRLGVLQPNNAGILVFWDADTLPTSWKIFFNGSKVYDVTRSQVAVPTPGTYSYLMQPLPQGASASVTMVAMAPGMQPSEPSLPVSLITAAAPFWYSSPLWLNLTERFDTTGIGDVRSFTEPISSYSIMVCGDGGNLASWTVYIEGSTDGVHYVAFFQHDSGSTADCDTTSTSSTLYPYKYIRLNCTALDLGTATSALVIVNGLP